MTTTWTRPSTRTGSGSDPTDPFYQSVLKVFVQKLFLLFFAVENKPV